MTLTEKLALIRHPRLKGLGSCLSNEAIEWSKNHTDFKAAWEACEHGTWMWWLVEALELPQVSNPESIRWANQGMVNSRSEAEDPNLTWARVIRALIPAEKMAAAFEGYVPPAPPTITPPGCCPTCGQSLPVRLPAREPGTRG